MRFLKWWSAFDAHYFKPEKDIYCLLAPTSAVKTFLSQPKIRNIIVWGDHIAAYFNTGKKWITCIGERAKI